MIFWKNLNGLKVLKAQRKKDPHIIMLPHYINEISSHNLNPVQIKVLNVTWAKNGQQTLKQCSYQT